MVDGDNNASWHQHKTLLNSQSVFHVHYLILFHYYTLVSQERYNKWPHLFKKILIEVILVNNII